MKKIALILGVIASVVVLASCATKSASTDQTAASTPAQTSGAQQHDYKGEK